MAASIGEAGASILINGVTIGPEGSGADIEIKSGVDITHLSIEIQDSLDEIVAAWDKNNGPAPVITSANDGLHSTNSLHYSDQAIDLRANNVTDQKAQQITDSLQALLGADYDVIFEHFTDNPTNDHIHVEYDPE